MKIKWVFFEFFFLVNSSTHKFFNSKSIVQKIPQMAVEVIWNCKPVFKFLFPTLNANIFQYVRSNFMKFLPYDFKQVKYKILRLFLEKVFFLFSQMNVAEMTVLSGFQ